MPLYWLELRWRRNQWCWRTLAAADRTRGSGTSQEGPWRGWIHPGGRVRLDGAEQPVEVHLADAQRPELQVERIDDGERFIDGQLDHFLQRWSDGRLWPLGQEPEEDEPLQDGDVFVLRSRAYRVHIPGALPETERVGIDLHDPTLELEIDPHRLRAVFSSSLREAVVTGECVRVLAVYARARSEGLHTGDNGWLTLADAHAAWAALGGRADSPPERMAWERGKLRTQLARQGARSLERLFEKRREGRSTEVRLGVARKNVHVTDD